MTSAGTVTSRDRHVLVIGAVSVAFILGIGKGVPALRNWEAMRIAEAGEIAASVRQLERGASTLSAVRDSATQLDQRLRVARRRLMSAASTENGVAMLAATVERLAEAQGVDVITIAMSRDTAARAGLGRVSVRLAADGDVAGLSDLLYEIETHDTPMAIRQLLVTQPDPGAPATRPEALHFELTVETLADIARVADRSPAR